MHAQLQSVSSVLRGGSSPHLPNHQPAHSRYAQAAPATTVSAAPSAAARLTRRADRFLPVVAASPTDRPAGHQQAPSDPPPRRRRGGGGSSSEAASKSDAVLPRPPTSYSGGPLAHPPSQQSRLAADAAAEATLAAAAKPAPAEAPEAEAPRPPRLASFRTAAAAAAAPPAPADAGAAPSAAAASPSSSTAGRPQGTHHRGIDTLRTKEHLFSCDEPSTCGGTILVALDDTENATEAVEWVARELYTPGVDELRVVHVVCDPRALHWQTSLGTSPSGRATMLDSLDLGLSAPPTPGGQYGGMEVTLQDYQSRLDRAAKAVVDRRCQRLGELGVEYQYDLPHLDTARSAAAIAEALLAAVRQYDAKLLVVANHGPGALAEYGSVSRYCYQHSAAPLLLVPSLDTAGPADTMGQQQQQQQQKVEKQQKEKVEKQGQKGKSEAAATAGTEILLVVNHLEELANVWQWVADNCAKKGDRLSIWHVAGPSVSGMPSLSVALENQMRRRGLKDVSYKQLYSATGDPQDLGEQVCSLAAGNPAVKMVVLLNYTRRGLVQEALQGSVASHLSRHCRKPLLLLQLPE